MPAVYRLNCEICSWNKIVKGEELGLHELKTSPVPVNTKRWDSVKNELVQIDVKKQPKKLRCPKCGRVVIPKKIDDSQKILENKIAEEERTVRIEAETISITEQLKKDILEKKKRLEDEKDKLNGGQAGPARPTI
jgi:hypothetical protein